MKRIVGGIVVVALAVAWWFYGYDYFTAPNTYRLDLLFMGIVAVVGSWNAQALIRSNQSYVTTARAEKAGLAQPGATLFARNQRLRYIVRTAESAWFLGLAALGLYAYYHPQVAATKWYGVFTITYIFALPGVTGVLTRLDLNVWNRLREIDSGPR